MDSYEPYRAALLARLSELDSRLHVIEAELDATPSKDWDEMAAEREGDEVLEHLGQAGQDEILRIRAALGRIRDRTYGDCAQCGDQIAPGRLAVLPEAALCARCAALA